MRLSFCLAHRSPLIAFAAIIATTYAWAPLVSGRTHTPLPQLRLQAIAPRPLAFEPNRGQFAKGVDFAARGGAYDVLLGGADAWFDLRSPAASRDAVLRDPMPVVHMQLLGSSRPHPAGVERLPGIANYYTFASRRVANRIEKVPTYAQVRYRDVYPGIDVVYYGDQGRLECDFIVAPLADPSAVRLRFDGADGVAVGRDGDLVIRRGPNVVRLRKPLLYQQQGAEARTRINGRYVRASDGSIAFRVGSYDRQRPLVIDPVVIAFGTYIGGSASDGAEGIDVDPAGNVYVTGRTESPNFPVNYSPPYATGDYDGYVVKFSADGKQLLYATYFSVAGAWNAGRDIKVDAGGEAYITGQIGPGNCALVARFDPNGVMVYGAALGNGGDNWGNGIAIDGAGHAWVTGLAAPGFDITAGAFQTTSGGDSDAFIAKIDTNADFESSLVYSTFLGGAWKDEGYRIAVDPTGAAYVTGSAFSSGFPTTPSAFQTTNGGGLADAFVAKLSADGNSLLYSTLFGGSAMEIGKGIAVDSSGNVYIGGYAEGPGVPTTTGAFHTSWAYGNCSGSSGQFKYCSDGFVAEFDPSKSGAASLIYSTYLGGSSADEVTSLAVDYWGNVLLAGKGYSLDFPLVNNISGSGGWGFVAELNAAGSALLFSTHYTDQINGLARLASSGSLYITGTTSETSGIATPGAFQQTSGGGYDGFVARIDGLGADPATPPSITFQPISMTVVPGQAATLSVTASGTAPLAYQWYLGTSGTTTAPIEGATAATYRTPALTSPLRCWVRVSNTGGSASSSTATISVSFTDDPLVAGTTVVRTTHLAELRTRVNALRSRWGLPAIAWTDALSAGVTPIRASQVVELRNALAAVYSSARRSAPSYTDPKLVAGTGVKRAHIAELRAAVAAVE